MPEGNRGVGHREALARKVEGTEGGGGESERVHAGADVMTEPREGELLGTHAAARMIRRLENNDLPARLGERDRGYQPVGAGSDDDCVDIRHRVVQENVTSAILPADPQLGVGERCLLHRILVHAQRARLVEVPVPDDAGLVDPRVV